MQCEGLHRSGYHSDTSKGTCMNPFWKITSSIKQIYNLRGAIWIFLLPVEENLWYLFCSVLGWRIRSLKFGELSSKVNRTFSKFKYFIPHPLHVIVEILLSVRYSEGWFMWYAAWLFFLLLHLTTCRLSVVQER